MSQDACGTHTKRLFLRGDFMKKVLTIQDISCFGKCSITVALPVLSAMGIETAILPTAVLSTHTLFRGFTVKDLSDQLIPITDHWLTQNIHFNAIYTGYLGNAEEIETAGRIFDEFKSDDTLIFIDPVMGDNGKLYPAFDMEYARLNAEFCSKADIIVPNITEACFMTGSEYKESYDEAYILALLDKLAKLGAGTVVLTGVSLSEGKTGVYGLDTKTGKTFIYQNDRVNASYHGTGDLFSSASLGAIMRGMSLPDAFRIAADYTARTIEVTLKNPENPWYGVDFEETIPDLIKML